MDKEPRMIVPNQSLISSHVSFRLTETQYDFKGRIACALDLICCNQVFIKGRVLAAT